MILLHRRVELHKYCLHFSNHKRNDRLTEIALRTLTSAGESHQNDNLLKSSALYWTDFNSYCSTEFSVMNFQVHAIGQLYVRFIALVL